MSRPTLWARLRALVVGRPRDLADRSLFHKMSLVSILAWVGLGADGLSSSCYGPEEAFKALGQYPALSVFVAMACVMTIAILCASYRQIIELFPTGGGGYLVATKLLGRRAGVVSGSALLVDYVLTIAISIASGADALFSVLPAEYRSWRIHFAAAGIALMTILNLRGTKESVLLWAPVFFVFLLTHASVILIAIGSHLGDAGTTIGSTTTQLRSAEAELGIVGVALLVLRAFCVGAGTFTGIEAVSNGLPVLRAPQAETGKKTMILMGCSLGGMVLGLLIAYLLTQVQPVDGKTLNAVLIENVTQSWPSWLAGTFVTISLFSATALLFIAAQAGFVDGPRVLANMALDRWFPARFANLSDRFVAQNGILVMGGTALAVLVLTEGSVGLLVVLYSINVFLTFSLSQLGMCVYWFGEIRRGQRGLRKLMINGVGLCVSASILIALCVIKFSEGGWVTLLATSSVILFAGVVRRDYARSARDLAKLDVLRERIDHDPNMPPVERPAPGLGRTAIVLCNGYNGLGVHTLMNIFRMFPATFDRCVFIEVSLLDAGSFRSAEAVDHLRDQTRAQANQYAELARRLGVESEIRTSVGHDVLATLSDSIDAALDDHPTAIIFGGKIAYRSETLWTRLLHNHVIFALHRRYCRKAVPFVIVPIRV
jgi:amino acid transporter